MRGRAQVTRCLFALADIDYEDIRVSREEWPEMKNKMPFGYLPVLDVDGTLIGGSLGIEKFVAKRCAMPRPSLVKLHPHLARVEIDPSLDYLTINNYTGLDGKNDLEEAIIDSYVLALYDLNYETVGLFKEKDEAKKPEMRRKFKDEILPSVFLKFEAILCKRSSGFLIGDEVSLADLGLYGTLDWLRVPTVVALDDEDMAVYPKILEHERRIQALPKMSAWVSRRPETAM